MGLRTQFFDRKLTLNITYFDADYTNLQAQTIDPVTNTFRLTNVGGLNTKGVEVDTLARLGSDFTFNGSLAYLDAKYTSYARAQCYPLQTLATGCVTTASPNYQDMTGFRAVQAPRWKWSAGVEYSPAVTEALRAVVQVNAQHTSAVNFTLRDPETFQKGYTIANVGLGVRAEDRKWEVTAFVNNVFDQAYYGSLVNSAGNWGGNVATQVVLPRDYRRYGGVRFGLNF